MKKTMSLSFYHLPQMRKVVRKIKRERLKQLRALAAVSGEDEREKVEKVKGMGPEGVYFQLAAYHNYRPEEHTQMIEEIEAHLRRKRTGARFRLAGLVIEKAGKDLFFVKKPFSARFTTAKLAEVVAFYELYYSGRREKPMFVPIYIRAGKITATVR